MKSILTLSGLLMSISATLLADEAAPAAKAQPTFIENMIPFLLIFVLMYFLIIRPQVKKAKEHAKLLEALQIGDEVVTTGGLIGRIRSVSDSFIVLDLGSTTVKVLKENITRTSFPKNASSKANGKDSKDEKAS